MRLLTIFTTILALSSAPLYAESLIYGEDDSFPKIEELNRLNEQFLNKQRSLADETTRENFGVRIRTQERSENTLDNLAIMQRLIDEERIERDDTERLQALGVVLGDIFVDQESALNWKVFEDDLGKSHAVCVEGTKHCLFPITMLSRRYEVGLKPDVKQVYLKGLNLVAEHLPKLPFSD